MSEFSNQELPPQDIPDRCLDCPMLDVVTGIYQERLDKHTATTTERSAPSIDAFFNEAAAATENVTASIYARTMEDVANIQDLIEREPAAANMPVSDFIRAHRTEENRLGDESLTPVLASLYKNEPRADDLSRLLTVKDAVRVSVDIMEHIKKRAETQLLLSPKVIEREIALIDTVDKLRQAQAEQIKAHYADQVKHLIDNCDDGPIEKRVGIFRRRAVTYCGSLALQQGKPAVQ